MALQATPYKVELNLTDMDRNVYDSLRFSMARHPSETAERLLSRLLARALWHAEQIGFGRGLSKVDEPAGGGKGREGGFLLGFEGVRPTAGGLICCWGLVARLVVLALGG